MSQKVIEILYEIAVERDLNPQEICEDNVLVGFSFEIEYNHIEDGKTMGEVTCSDVGDGISWELPIGLIPEGISDDCWGKISKVLLRESHNEYFKYYTDDEGHLIWEFLQNNNRYDEKKYLENNFAFAFSEILQKLQSVGDILEKIVNEKCLP